MDAIERAVPVPQIEVVMQRRARRQVLRDRPPLAAGAQNVHKSVDDLVQIHGPLVAPAPGRRNKGRDQRPFFVGHIARITQAGIDTLTSKRQET